MGKNIKIIPGDGEFQFSGSTASTINLTYSESDETLKFAGANNAIILRDDPLYETDARFNVEGSGKVKIGGTDRIDSLGVWQGPAAVNATGQKGVKGIGGPTASTADQGDKGPT